MTMRTLDLSGLCDILTEPRPTLIVFHARPDADAVGSAFALRALLRAAAIKADCACADEVPERLRFLMGNVQSTVCLPPEAIASYERAVSVDAASPSQLGSLYEAVKDRLVAMIDHHESGVRYANAFVDPHAAATGELIFDISEELLRRGVLSHVGGEVYTALYAAISSDTGAFRYANVTPKTLRTVARLLEQGVDGADINHRLYESKSIEQLTAEREAAATLVLAEGGRVASVAFSYERKTALGLLDEHLETVIDIPRTLHGVQIAFAVRQPTAEPHFRVSMRANVDLDVAAICASLGGGGHRRAAGCGIEAHDIEDARRIVTEAIRKQYFR